MKRKRIWDLLLTGGILLLAGILFLASRPGRHGAWVVVTRDGAEIGRYALGDEHMVTIGEDEWNVLRISHGAAAVAEANCGDHTCVRTGEISREGESIVCLPHHLIIRIEGVEQTDFDIGVG